MVAILQTAFWNAFSWKKMFTFWYKFHRNLALIVPLTIRQYWFRQWLGAEHAASHYLNQWWPISLVHVCKVRSPRSKRQWVNISSGNGLVPVGHQAITWTNIDQVSRPQRVKLQGWVDNLSWKPCYGIRTSAWTLLKFLSLTTRVRYGPLYVRSIPQVSFLIEIYSRLRGSKALLEVISICYLESGGVKHD